MSYHIRRAAVLTAFFALACSDTVDPPLQLDGTVDAAAQRPRLLSWNATPEFVIDGVARAGTPLRLAPPAPLAVDQSSGATGSDEMLSWSHTVTNGSNRLLVVAVSIRNAGKSVERVTYGSDDLQLLGTQENHDGAVKVELWYRIAPQPGTAIVTVDLTKSAKAAGAAASFTGVDPANPFSTVAWFGSVGSGQPAFTITSAPNEIVFAAVGSEGDAGAFDPHAATQVSQWSLFYGTSGGDVASAGSTMPGADVISAGWTTDHDNKLKWAIGAVSLRQAPSTVPVPDTYTVDFWAVRGAERSVQINYLDGDVEYPFLRLRTSEPSFVPGAGDLAPGDSVLISLTVDPELLHVEMEPSGLQFATPATLRMWYTGAGPDFNDDGTVDGQDEYLEQSLMGLWYNTASTPWVEIPSEQSTTEDWLQSLLDHFSGYAVAF